MRSEVRNALLALTILGVILLLIFSRGKAPTSLDPRHSTFLHGPEGSAGLSATLERLGFQVEVQRRRYTTLDQRADSSGRALFAVLDPAVPLRRSEGILLADWPRSHGDLLLAGTGADAAISCFGYRSIPRGGDSVLTFPPGQGGEFPSYRVEVLLARHLANEIVDSGGSAGTLRRCRVPPIEKAETLLVTQTGRVVAVRLHPEGYAGSVTIVSDGQLFSNRLLREPVTGPFAIKLFLNSGDRRFIFDERHQGFGPTGSLLAAALSWSESAPLGWAIWQLIAIGAIMLLAGMVRFGPPRPLDDRQRRSALEHVTALATALSAANGHDTAIRLMIRGLGRRLSPDRRSAPETGELLTRLTPIVRTPKGRGAINRLKSLTRPGQPADAVLAAANAVEDVWQDLRP